MSEAGPGPSRGAGGGAVGEALRRAIGTPSLRAEILWVLLNKGTEFVLLFALLKLLTNQLGKAGYGEYNLAEAAVLLVSSLLLLPVQESYLRDYHGAVERGERRAAGVFLLRWFAVTTLAVVGVVALLSVQLSGWLGVSHWTPLAAGLVFLFERWRFLGQDVLNIQRRRRAWALSNLAYSVTLIVVMGLTVTLGPSTPAAALFAYAATSACFGLLVAGPLVRDVLRSPRERPSDMAKLVVSFGLPYAALLLFQWVQGFGDRYLVKLLLDAAEVGLYVAAYQVCGIPFALVLRVAHQLLTPIAYQRSRDAEDPAQLWAADRLLLAGIAFQLVAGMAMLVGYALFGAPLLVLLTNESFVLPTGTLVALAAARFVQSLAQATQPIFAVHHRLAAMLWFRALGAALTFAICGVMIQRQGIEGAALGTLIALSGYLAVLVFAPGGCWWLVAEARPRAHRQVAAGA